MAQVSFSERLRTYTGEVRDLTIVAENYRDLVSRLAERFPGIEEVIEENSAVAIDGVIISEPFLEPLEMASEVHFLERLGGG